MIGGESPPEEKEEARKFVEKLHPMGVVEGSSEGLEKISSDPEIAQRFLTIQENGFLF